MLQAPHKLAKSTSGLGLKNQSEAAREALAALNKRINALSYEMMAFSDALRGRMAANVNAQATSASAAVKWNYIVGFSALTIIAAPSKMSDQLTGHARKYWITEIHGALETV